MGFFPIAPIAYPYLNGHTATKLYSSVMSHVGKKQKQRILHFTLVRRECVCVGGVGRRGGREEGGENATHAAAHHCRVINGQPFC